MTEKITHNIKITVVTAYRGHHTLEGELKHAFAYTITIENQSEFTVQVISRYWKIEDVLSPTEIVSGEGVVGRKPVLEPGQKHTYSSGCLLNGGIGSMEGFYSMLAIEEKKQIRVAIPKFNLLAFTLQN